MALVGAFALIWLIAVLVLGRVLRAQDDLDEELLAR
jgi:hypothetical protein